VAICQNAPDIAVAAATARSAVDHSRHPSALY
jgi:hypothetical protein